MKHDRPKISDVARLAGVSTATVSRALSTPERVSEDTRAAVQQAVEATGYRLNLAARNLRHRRTGGIVALVPNLANPFFSQILSGIASVLGPAGYNLLIADTRTADAQTLLDYAEPSRADGLIILDGTLPAAALQGRVPVVEACEWVPGLPAPRVKIDNRAAAGLAVDHLADLGHCRIGHVAGPRGNVLTEARLSGTVEALAARGLPFPEDYLYPGDFSLDSGRAAARIWLDQPAATRPTAVFFASDAMACGFIGEVQRHGLRVPGDLSVVGFDDIELVAHISPPLTTIRQPRTEIGRAAAERMLACLKGEARDADTVLPVELILRASTGPAPA
ncbi:MAG: LacI family transcriptional regulator [Rhodobacterales bacterium 65-51]|jgi:LacI family repressor for deo operon, udp, cdd, tsx, nupC, and nupG|uniref:LacI family transcriptional regulator n=1 Tax=Gemmobacter nanjingensis TaxID=488454 RepID=A0ABQ3FE21_9RHOB|nr:LacI family DNA-binding transcriptional regulator [Gemmobacter nanjingensis]OJY28203.1 MAG: LacI family transcriptional regulator [Rhodobacterales bacterium 65-51]GHC20318.1 LacI family transcriptional regulator [Gemmobacter nanjingensis]